MLFVECESGSRVTGLKLELLGDVVSPSTVAYLDNGVVFVGSSFGDPQLVKVSVYAQLCIKFVLLLFGLYSSSCCYLVCIHLVVAIWFVLIFLLLLFVASC